MNCFWIVSLRYWAQHSFTRGLIRRRCELLLNCIFEILSTTNDQPFNVGGVLWIAFELYLWDIEHNGRGKNPLTSVVVNCFWIVSLRYWAQHRQLLLSQVWCCELLLNCIFEILSTTELFIDAERILLWIAFELYLWDIEHNRKWIPRNVTIVVNCFWIVSLRYWAQLFQFRLYSNQSCELLLNCIFEILSTTVTLRHTRKRCCELLLNCIFEILSTTPVYRWH